jgi:hypothetical protein
VQQAEYRFMQQQRASGTWYKSNPNAPQLLTLTAANGGRKQTILSFTEKGFLIFRRGTAGIGNMTNSPLNWGSIPIPTETRRQHAS